MSEHVSHSDQTVENWHWRNGYDDAVREISETDEGSCVYKPRVIDVSELRAATREQLSWDQVWGLFAGTISNWLANLRPLELQPVLQ